MHVYILFLLIIVMGSIITIKAGSHKSEWMLLLILLSFIKTCITFLFEATTVFTVFTAGSIQYHLDDIILVILCSYCLINIPCLIKGGPLAKNNFLILVPVSVSLLRGILSGSTGSSYFFADARTFITFFSAFYGFYFLLRRPQHFNRLWKFRHYIDNLMNIILVYIFFVWALDLFFEINDLPGQIAGTLSDSGSTLRIIHPSQALMIAAYTLYKIYLDLNETKKISIRTLLFMLIILLLQWRTVVAAFGAGCLILFFLIAVDKGIPYKFMKEIFILSMILLLFLLFEWANSSGIMNEIIHFFKSFSNMFQGRGTFLTRTRAWHMILDSLTGMNAVFGKPFGQSLGISWTASAHNGYIDYIAKMGYWGIVNLILFILSFVAESIKSKNYILTSISLMICVYWFGYGFSIEQGALLGFGLGILEHSKKESFGKGRQNGKRFNICR